MGNPGGKKKKNKKKKKKKELSTFKLPPRPFGPPLLFFPEGSAPPLSPCIFHTSMAAHNPSVSDVGGG